MKLTFEILKQELTDRFDCTVSGTKKNDFLIESPKLYEESLQTIDELVFSNHCYVLQSLEQLDHGESALTQTEAFLIVCEQVPEDILDGSSLSILYFEQAQPVQLVFNTLIDVFAKYRQWIDALIESLLKSGSINSLLKLSIPIFRNPLFLIDSRFYLIAEASPDDKTDTEHPIRKVDEEWIIRGKEELLSAMEFNKPFSRNLPDDYPRLFINLTEDEYLLGNLSVQASHQPLRECEGYLLEQLANIVHTAMLRSVSPDSNWRTQIERMLSEIIAGSSVDEEEFLRALSYFGYTRGDQFRCLAIRIPKISGKEFIRNFMQILGTQIPAIYVPTPGEIVAMITSVLRTVMQVDEDISLIERKMSALGFRVGASEIFDDLQLAQHYFAQARYALVQGEVTQSEKNVTLFSDYSLEYILENAPGELKPNMLFNDGFRKLMVHDKTGRANYVETIRAYLNNNLNAYRTAAELNISRNSLLSRLERMQAMIDEDLSDIKVRFRYELSLLLFDKWSEEDGE